MVSQEIITSSISWEVNNGDNINFLFDSSNGFPPLATTDSLKDFSNIVIQAWGTSFSNYVLDIHRFTWLFIWQDPSILPISHNLTTSFKEV